MENELLNEIRAFLSRTGMGRTYFGKLAANNGWLVDRLEAGKTVTVRTVERVRAFIAEHSTSEAAE